jgi:hypothetical protein
MDKRLLFPALAMTAVAQTTSPVNAKAEKALRARAEEFYRFEIAKDRQAETLVADDSKDYFYNSGKPNLKDVKIGNIEFADGGKKAIVHITASVELMAPTIGAQTFSAPAVSDWKLEKGKWFWYYDKDTALKTPFGKMTFADTGPNGSMMDITKSGAKPSVASLQSLVKIDRQAVALTAAAPDQTVVLTNGLPGPITLLVRGMQIEGVSVELEKGELKTGEKVLIRFHKKEGSPKASGTMTISAMPMDVEFPIQVRSE